MSDEGSGIAPATNHDECSGVHHSCEKSDGIFPIVVDLRRFDTWIRIRTSLDTRIRNMTLFALGDNSGELLKGEEAMKI